MKLHPSNQGARRLLIALPWWLASCSGSDGHAESPAPPDDLSDKATVQALGDASMAATACIGDRFEPDRRRSYEISEKIEAITANTPERARRYMQYMAALSGTSTASPEGNTCEE